jgi:hypothetical protein
MSKVGFKILTLLNLEKKIISLFKVLISFAGYYTTILSLNLEDSEILKRSFLHDYSFSECRVYSVNPTPYL